MRIFILATIFVVSTCGIIYELIAGTVSSYLLGDTIGQFSTVIGVYLFSMGLGSYASKFIHRNDVMWFIRIEILIGLIGGLSPILLFMFFEQAYYFKPLYYLLLTVTGALVGLEIPLLMRIIKNQSSFNDLVAEVFTFDYIGALLASLVFPSLLIPYLGILRTSSLFGLLNVLVGFLLIRYFSKTYPYVKKLYWQAGAVGVLLLAAFVYSGQILKFIESHSYEDQVIISRHTSYQKLTVTKSHNDVRLFINGNLQFSSQDEYRYHESLVYPLFAHAGKTESVLILGGGDGLALREVLRHDEVKEVTLVDLDPAMTDLFSGNVLLAGLNEHALSHPKVKVVHDDAFVWLREKCQKQYDCVIIDFPDPSNYSLGKLYSYTFFKYLGHCLAPGGVACIQSTSPYYAPLSFWCIYNTLNYSHFKCLPYHVHVPSFGEWGYILFSKQDLVKQKQIPGGLKFMNEEVWKSVLYFPADMAQRETEINQLNNQALVTYFEHEWSRFK